MAIDIDLFHFQLSDLEVSRSLFESGIRDLEQAGHLRDGLFAASSGIPGPPEEEALDLESRQQARTVRRLREMLARMTYVFAWSCLEDLLKECVKEVFLAQPQRVLDIGDWWRDGRLIKQQVVEGWDREQVIAELVDAALRNFNNQPFTKVPDYFTKRLAVPWPSYWQNSLTIIADRRNAAAHDLRFTAQTRYEIDQDLWSIREHGESIARAVALKHKLDLQSSTIDEMRQGSTEDDGV